MDKKMMLNTTIDFEFCDGSKTKLTLAFYLINKLRSKNKTLYDRYNKYLTKGSEDFFDMIGALYVAYVCAHIDADDLMSEEEFIVLCGSDVISVSQAFEKLTNPKKIKASENPS